MTKPENGLEMYHNILLDMLKTALALPVKSGSTDAFSVKKTIEDAVKKCGYDSLGENVDWKRLIRCADSHGVLSLIADELEFIPGVEDSLRKYSMDKAKRIVLQNSRLLELSAYYLKLLNDNKITAVLLKGAQAASHYPIGELRKSGDIDILIADGQQFQRAVDILLSHGLSRVEEQHAGYHEELRGKSGIILEIHHSLSEQFDNDDVNQKLAEYTRDMSRHISVKIINGRKIYALSEAYEALTLVIHMLHHYLRAGFGLKLLCDWTVFWNRDIPDIEKEIFAGMLDELMITGFVYSVNTICIDRLGLSASNVDFMMKKGVPADTEALLKDIIEAEEFGDADSSRMVAMRGTSVKDYLREFHHQMKLNNPSASRRKLLWPYLWLKTLIIFIRNNKKVRNTTVGGILKSAGKRSRLTKDMKLFTKP